MGVSNREYEDVYTRMTLEYEHKKEMQKLEQDHEKRIILSIVIGVVLVFALIVGGIIIHHAITQHNTLGSYEIVVRPGQPVEEID